MPPLTDGGHYTHHPSVSQREFPDDRDKQRKVSGMAKNKALTLVALPESMKIPVTSFRTHILMKLSGGRSRMTRLYWLGEH